jgi:rhodanese-related sulfurtransferase
MFARLMGLATISPKALYERMQHETMTVIDVNARQSWLSARVPGALNLEPLSFEAGALPDDKSAALVFYCSNYLCRKAPNAALRAKKMGYERVHVMSAGITGWAGASLPTESGDRA